MEMGRPEKKKGFLSKKRRRKKEPKIICGNLPCWKISRSVAPKKRGYIVRRREERGAYLHKVSERGKQGIMSEGGRKVRKTKTLSGDPAS